MMLSGLSLLGLDEMEAKYARYPLLADLIRKSFTDPQGSLKELFSRLIFNVLIGNTDDHARNHAAFWDGDYLCFTPAYDLCPQLRVGREATQAAAADDAGALTDGAKSVDCSIGWGWILAAFSLVSLWASGATASSKTSVTRHLGSRRFEYAFGASCIDDF